MHRTHGTAQEILTARLAKLEKLARDDARDIVLARVGFLAPAVAVAVEAGRVRRVPRARVGLQRAVEDCGLVRDTSESSSWG